MRVRIVWKDSEEIVEDIGELINVQLVDEGFIDSDIWTYALIMSDDLGFKKYPIERGRYKMIAENSIKKAARGN